MESKSTTAALILARYPEAGRVVYGGQEPQGEALARSYKYWRALGQGATRALELAESDVVQGRSRWPSSVPDRLASYQNRPGKRGGRWIESPDAAGLRFIGFADEIAKSHGWRSAIGHKGWFADDFQDSVKRGAVYQLPTDREGRPRYVPAYREGSEGKRGWTDDSGQEGAAVVFLAELELGEPGGLDSHSGTDRELWQAASRADRLAELAAEESRAWSEASSAGCDYASAIEEAATARRAFLALRQAIKAEARPAAPAICKELAASLRSYAAEWRQAKRQAAELRDSWRSAWRGELREAFAESAGLALESL